MSSKLFVLDTSVLLYDPECLYKFEENEVTIPAIVLEELNHYKEEISERGYSARKVIRLLEKLSAINPLKEGVKLFETTIRTSYNQYNKEIAKDLFMDKNDYKIISCAKNLKAILVTRDQLMRVIARDFVTVEDYEADKIKTNEFYKGYRQAVVSKHKIDQLFENKLSNEYGLFPNEFVILQNEENLQNCAVGINKRNRIYPCNLNTLNTNGLKLKLTPLNLEQKMLMYLLLDQDIKCVTVSGTSGRGKSLLTIDYALSTVFAQRYNKFIYTKSVIAVDSQEELGFYKGDPLEKLKPHLQPLYSSIEYLYQKEIYKKEKRISVDEKVQEFQDKDILTFFPLANIRGMSVFNKVIMLDEAQNTTNHTIKSLVTRINDNSKLIIAGDIEQIDDRNLNEYNNGLVHLVEAGKDEDFIGHITMDIDSKSRRGQLSGFGAKKL